MLECYDDSRIDAVHALELDPMYPAVRWHVTVCTHSSEDSLFVPLPRRISGSEWLCFRCIASRKLLMPFERCARIRVVVVNVRSSHFARSGALEFVQGLEVAPNDKYLTSAWRMATREGTRRRYRWVLAAVLVLHTRLVTCMLRIAVEQTHSNPPHTTCEHSAPNIWQRSRSWLVDQPRRTSHSTFQVQHRTAKSKCFLQNGSSGWNGGVQRGCAVATRVTQRVENNNSTHALRRTGASCASVWYRLIAVIVNDSS